MCQVLHNDQYIPTLFVSLQSIVTVEDGKMVHVQKWDGKETSLVREVDGNNLTLVGAHATCILLISVFVCLFPV